MEVKSISIINFSGERVKLCMWSGELLSRSWLRGYNVILRDAVKTPVDNEEEKIKEDDMLNQLNKNAYNDLILAQDDTVFFHIVE